MFFRRKVPCCTRIVTTASLNRHTEPVEVKLMVIETDDPEEFDSGIEL
ncbi:MAG: hypothetical protein KME46_33290 [Brasilonema angustatum HA4187-MV1]|nr:hypothetical protein [Brasilonema angustatum HA4187-MV1]